MAVGLSVTIVLAGVLLALALHLRARDTQPSIPRPSGVPSNLSDATVNLMQLSPVPHRAAPNFTLRDQHGQSISLHSLRGKNVVLNFMDPHCTDICPIVSQELIDANHDLGPLAKNTVFLAITVNQFHASVAAVAKFSNEHRLNTIASWHFLTGPLRALETSWSNYGVAVSAPSRNADIQHTSVIYFINARGQEEYLAAPVVDHTKKGVAFLPEVKLNAWGQGIAQVVKDLTN